MRRRSAHTEGTDKAAYASGSPLRALEISGSPQLGDEVATVLAPYVAGSKGAQLRELKLVRCGLTSEGLQKLEAALEKSAVTLLDLSYNELGGALSVFRGLAGAPLLEDLRLNGCDLDDEDVAHIAQELPTSSLATLELNNNCITAAGALKLAEHLSSSQLNEMDLSHNDITPGDEMGRLAAAWAGRGRLNIAENKLSYQEMRAFFEMMETLVA